MFYSNEERNISLSKEIFKIFAIISTIYCISNIKKREIAIKQNEKISEINFAIEHNFTNLLPRKSPNDENIPILEEIFNSRELYINENNLTN